MSLSPDSCWKVLDEILSTENSYIACMDLCQLLYINPLSGSELSFKLSQNDIRTLFSNLEHLYAINHVFVKELDLLLSYTERKGANEWLILVQSVSNVANLFLRFGPQFKMYSMYASAFPLAQKRLTEIQAENAQFNAFLAITANDVRCKGNNLCSYLIMPVQRIPRYVMLLKECLKYVSQASDEKSLYAISLLNSAISKLVESVLQVNESIRSRENGEIIAQIQRQELKDAVNIFAPNRRFVRRGKLFKIRVGTNSNDLSKNNSKEHDFFLFNDLLIYTTPSFLSNKPKVTLIPIDRSFAVLRGECTEHYSLLKICSSVKNILLYFEHQPYMDAWLKDFELCLEEFNNASVGNNMKISEITRTINFNSLDASDYLSPQSSPSARARDYSISKASPRSIAVSTTKNSPRVSLSASKVSSSKTSPRNGSFAINSSIEPAPSRPSFLERVVEKLIVSASNRDMTSNTELNNPEPILNSNSVTNNIPISVSENALNFDQRSTPFVETKKRHSVFVRANPASLIPFVETEKRHSDIVRANAASLIPFVETEKKHSDIVKANEASFVETEKRHSDITRVNAVSVTPFAETEKGHLDIVSANATSLTPFVETEKIHSDIVITSENIFKPVFTPVSENTCTRFEFLRSPTSLHSSKIDAKNVSSPVNSSPVNSSIDNPLKVQPSGVILSEEIVSPIADVSRKLSHVNVVASKLEKHLRTSSTSNDPSLKVVISPSRNSVVSSHVEHVKKSIVNQWVPDIKSLEKAKADVKMPETSSKTVANSISHNRSHSKVVSNRIQELQSLFSGNTNAKTTVREKPVAAAGTVASLRSMFK